MDKKEKEPKGDGAMEPEDGPKKEVDEGVNDNVKDDGEQQQNPEKDVEGNQ